MIFDTREFVAAAEGELLRPGDSTEALARLGWSPRPNLGAIAERGMLAALFEAEGTTLAVTPALGSLVAAALSAGTEAPAAVNVAAAIGRREGSDVSLLGTAGLLEASATVIDIAGEGIFVGGRPHPANPLVEPLDPAVVVRATVPFGTLEQLRPEPEAGGQRAAARTLARLAVAHALIGIGQRVLERAVTHAADRRQFGAPIGSFQAVAHLLAQAHIQLVAMRAASETLIGQPPESDPWPDPDDADIICALTGRNVRRILQATLQVFGAIGFTWEHEHHRYARRALALDALAGPGAGLARSQAQDALAAGSVRRVTCPI